MFISLTKPERDNFMSQTKDCLIPGYTGHCPTLKFRIGKRYGANTRDIIQEMTDRGLLKKHLANTYRKDDPLKKLIDTVDQTQKATKDKINTVRTKCRPFILGYTGFIPGMNFRYGKTYGAAADESLYNNSVTKALKDSKKALETSFKDRSKLVPKLLAVKPKEQLEHALLDYTESNKYRDEHISPELPPIAGYTGHIPRVKSSDASLSQRYAVAAKKGLYLLHQDRQKLKSIENIDQSTKENQMTSSPY